MTVKLITTGAEFNALPIGTEIIDSDGWVHTKTRDAELNQDGENVTGEPLTTYVDNEGGRGTFYSVWNWGGRVEVEPERPERRPTIDFGGDSRATAREYAESLLTTNLVPDNYAVLKDASLGYVVDAYALNEAVLDAMRQAATRFSQSSQRRESAKRAAYLGHVTQAVLENHADQLPAYEPGERSRAVQSWKEIATSHQTHIETLTEEAEERVRLLDEASDALRQAKHEVDLGTQYREFADAEVTRLLLELEEANRRAELAEAERDAAAATISYVAERLYEVGRAEMLGYWEGVKDATLPVNDES